MRPESGKYAEGAASAPLPMAGVHPALTQHHELEHQPAGESTAQTAVLRSCVAHWSPYVSSNFMSLHCSASPQSRALQPLSPFDRHVHVSETSAAKDVTGSDGMAVTGTPAVLSELSSASSAPSAENAPESDS